MRIDPDVLRAMREHADLADPHEACGAVFARIDPGARGAARCRGPVECYRPLDNRATDPRRQFRVDEVAWWRITASEAELGRVCVGFFHSHPTGRGSIRGALRPSLDDRIGLWPEHIAWIGVSRPNRFAVTAWQHRPDRSLERVGLWWTSANSR